MGLSLRLRGLGFGLSQNSQAQSNKLCATQQSNRSRAWGLRGLGITYLWLAGSEGIEQKMETPIMGYNGLYMNYFKDPFLHAQLTKGQYLGGCVQVDHYILTLLGH